MLRSLVVLMLSCVGVQALMLHPAGPRIAAVRASPTMMLPLLPMTALAEAGQSGNVDAPIGVIVAGAVLATLTAGLPVCVLPPFAHAFSARVPDIVRELLAHALTLRLLCHRFFLQKDKTPEEVRKDRIEAGLASLTEEVVEEEAPTEKPPSDDDEPPKQATV